MRRNFLIIVLLSLLLLVGCAGTQGKSVQAGNVAGTVAQVAADAPGLAHQLDGVYDYLVKMKAIPDNTAEATKALAALDQIAPAVQQAASGAQEALGGDKVNWAQFVIQGR